MKRTLLQYNLLLEHVLPTQDKIRVRPYSFNSNIKSHTIKHLIHKHALPTIQRIHFLLYLLVCDQR